MAEWAPKPATVAIVDAAREVISGAHAIGYRPTLRRVFYLLVTREMLPNTLRAYKNLSATLDRARWEGWLDLDCLDDLERQADVPATWESPHELLVDAAHSYRSDWWAGAEAHVEVWVEKRAIVGIAQTIANRWNVPFLACRGFTSLTSLAEAAKRFDGRGTVVLYAGDYDPSGREMDRDLQDRLTRLGCDVELRRLALTREQIEEHNLPHQPTKTGDSRARGWTEAGSWEVDALPDAAFIAVFDEHLEQLAPAALWQRRRSDQTARVAILDLADSLDSD